MADFIYARVSTNRTQSTEGQENQLQQRFPNARVITEIASGIKDRPMLIQLISELVAGDRLIVSALDRLGRRATEILLLIERLNKRGITLYSAREDIDYSTTSGRFVTQILVLVAEMERSMISERTKVGLENARNKGKRIGAPVGNRNKRGKKKKRSPEFVARFIRLQKALTPKELATELGLSLVSIYRLFKEFKLTA